MENENIRMGAPYDEPAFESLCREMSIWGTAQAALCAVFWRKGGEVMAESIGAGGVSALVPSVKTCLWLVDEESIWQTECGNAFAFTLDGPRENGAAHCLYCGGKLVTGVFKGGA